MGGALFNYGVYKTEYQCIAIGGVYDIISEIVNYYRYYLIGYLCSKYIRLNNILFKNEIVVAIAQIAFLANWYFFEYHNMLLIFAGSVGAIVTLQNFVKSYVDEHSKIGLLLIYIGKCSLGIYVIHYFLIPTLPFFNPIIDVKNPFIWQLTISFLISIPIISVSVIVYKLIEGNRWLNLLMFGKKYNK